jgi:stage V sporulation protein D (sporulation-specific penicillin-binding protein)
MKMSSWVIKIFRDWRINLVLIFILLFGAAIVSRLISLQIVDHGLYKALAQGQQNTFRTIKGQRGDILFSEGETLATNAETKYVFVCPEEIEEKEKTAQKLSEIFSIDKEKIDSIVQKNSLFEKIKNSITEQEETLLKEHNLKGVYVGQSPQRNYPQKEMASSAVGFVGGSGIGQYGIEGFYNDILDGEENFSGVVFSGSADGSDIFLSLNYNVQFMAENFLKEAAESLNIEGGQIIVADPNSGQIIALADYPGFDPNHYSTIEDFNLFQNESVQELFEPGSTVKALTMAAGIDQGKVNSKTTYLDEGTVEASNHVIKNYNNRVFGKVTMTEVLEKSINTGIVFVEKELGHKAFLDYFDKFGFFSPTGIDFQGEVFSENKELKKGYEINFATASFGQGVKITPIQLVGAFSAIANGGKLVTPNLLDTTGKNKKEITETRLNSFDRVISSETASELTAMLVSVIENGYSKSAKIPGYYIAGKTGTSQVPYSSIGIDKRGYSEKTWQSAIGFFPAFDAQFIVFVKLDNPAAGTAEYSALPIFKKMTKHIIDYYAIPPDY